MSDINHTNELILEFMNSKKQLNNIFENCQNHHFNFLKPIIYFEKIKSFNYFKIKFSLKYKFNLNKSFYFIIMFFYNIMGLNNIFLNRIWV